MICFTEVRFLQTYSPLRWSQRPGLFQPFPSLKRSLGPSELSLLNHLEHKVPTRTTTRLVSLASITSEFDRNERIKEEESNPSARARKNTSKSLSLITRALCGIGEDLISLVCLVLNAIALVRCEKSENVDTMNGGWLGVFIAPTTKLAVW